MFLIIAFEQVNVSWVWIYFTLFSNASLVNLNKYMLTGLLLILQLIHSLQLNSPNSPHLCYWSYINDSCNLYVILLNITFFLCQYYSSSYVIKHLVLSDFSQAQFVNKPLNSYSWLQHRASFLLLVVSVELAIWLLSNLGFLFYLQFLYRKDIVNIKPILIYDHFPSN